MNFISELKRRNVIRMAGKYLLIFVGGPLGPKQQALDIRLPQAASYENCNEIFE